MGKLNIAHHKSYHPYRRDNIERVRRDEEEARTREAVEEGRMLLADSEARMDLLRQRAGLGTKAQGKRDRDRDREDDVERAISQRDAAAAEAETSTRSNTARPSTLTSTTGHINLFEDLERQGSMALMPVRSTKKGPPAASESEKGVALAPSAKDLNPWYSDRDHERTREQEVGEDKRLRDLARKSVHDPLTSINSQLASRDRPSSSLSSSYRRPGPRPRPGQGPPSRPPPGSSATVSADSPSAPSAPAPAAPGPRASTERLTRESAERQRALELIRRKKKMEGGGSEPPTPSTVRGGGYGDVFNRREVEEVQRARRREHDRDRDWGRGRERDRERYGERYGESYGTRR